jgi:hypothetical protein
MRCIGPWDQKGSREAASDHCDTGRSRLAGPQQFRRGLSELVDALLQQFLIVAEIGLHRAKVRQLIGKTRQQRNGCGKPTECCLNDVFLTFLHHLTPQHHLLRLREQERPSCPQRDIESVAPISTETGFLLARSEG